MSIQRKIRLVRGLLTGPKTREQVDRIAGASNGPEIIRQLRALGLRIDCRMMPSTDRDGLPCRYGLYSLASMAQAEAWLRDGHVPA